MTDSVGAAISQTTWTGGDASMLDDCSQAVDLRGNDAGAPGSAVMYLL